MSAADVYRYVVDLHGTDRPRPVEFVIQASPECEAKAGITGRNVYARSTDNAGLRSGATMGNTDQKVAKGHKLVEFAVRIRWPDQERVCTRVSADTADAAHVH